MQPYIVLPLIIPLLMALTVLARFRTFRRRLALIGALANLLACIALLIITETGEVQVSQMGGHPAPFGITLVVDPLSAIMLTISSIIMFTVVIYSRTAIDANRERFAYYPLLGCLLLGINLAFLTGDLFTLYVAFEIMLMASFVLLTLGGERGQLEGGLKYVVLNIVGSTLFLIAIGLTYAVAGTLNLADLAQRLLSAPSLGITTVLAGLFLIAFGIKAAIFPLFFWLPASYHTPPIAVTALFGGLLTKVGIYSMWRVLVMVFSNELVVLQPLLLGLAMLTMITGVLGAVAQMELRRLLSFHIVSQIGYLLMGTALLTQAGLAGAVFFMVHVILAKTALFYISGIAHAAQGSYDLKKLGGMRETHPGVALLFLLAAFSLAGLPPLSGFWAKLMLIRAALEIEQYLVVGVALGVSLLTMYSMVKIWNEAFWTPPAPGRIASMLTRNERLSLLIPASVLVILIVVVGLLAEPMYRLSSQAANTVMQPSVYIESVLPESGVEE
ncbi:MAG: Na+/H+ antiporter subunit D [Anaerolinea sp.]|nr:Na+/H+ antiporter subunit D [Anaerolinea sp.]